jgi:hypothetical protein
MLIRFVAAEMKLPVILLGVSGVYGMVVNVSSDACGHLYCPALGASWGIAGSLSLC